MMSTLKNPKMNKIIFSPLLCFLYIFLTRCLVSFPPGFIDFIVEPTFSVLVDTTEKIISPLIEEALKSGGVRRAR